MSKGNVMKSTILVAGIGLLILFATGCDKLRSRDALNHGVQAFKGAQIDKVGLMTPKLEAGN